MRPRESIKPFVPFFLVALMFLVTGCGADPAPRLMSLIGSESLPLPGTRFQDHEWIRLPTISLVVHSDDTGPDAAPAISANYLETLTRRAVAFLREQCAYQDILVVPPISPYGNFSLALKSQHPPSSVSHQILVVFSGRERIGPEKIGEATVMTQMSGTVVEHSALAEVGVLRLLDRRVVFFVSGRGAESLEQLDVPIGSNRLSPRDARDILRAQAGQQALDRALDQVGAACRIGKSSG